MRPRPRPNLPFSIITDPWEYIRYIFTYLYESLTFFHGVFPSIGKKKSKYHKTRIKPKEPWKCLSRLKLKLDIFSCQKKHVGLLGVRDVGALFGVSFNHEVFTWVSSCLGGCGFGFIQFKREENNKKKVSKFSFPKDHWTLKTGYFEDPTSAIQVQTLPLEGPRSLGLGLSG